MDEVIIPEDVTTLSDAELASLYDDAVTAFQALVPEEGSPTEEDLATLDALAAGINDLKGEKASREEASLARMSRAKELAEGVLGLGEAAEEVVAEEDGEAEAMVEDVEESPAEEAVAEEVVASSKRAPISINLGALKKDAPKAKPAEAKVAVAAQGAAGFSVGSDLTIKEMAQSINSRLGGFNASSYQLAAERGVRMSERFAIAKFQRNMDEKYVVQTEDPGAAMKAAVEGQYEGNSLVASGGWCAPSETIYDLCKISEQANLLKIPEIQVNRGGIRHTIGPDFSAVYADTGFCYTEAEDIAGDYNGAGGGTKPCADVPCPSFVDDRLDYCGVCISAGLLQQRGYPEVIEDYIAKAMDAHAHRVSAAVINDLVAGSTAVALPAGQAGATAPLLTAIDLQATHYRALNRMSDNASLEVVLPTWIKGVLRSDLARRLGVDLLDVPDSRISKWFSERNVKVQFVVDWQDIATTAASGFTSWPASVTFLIYSAGTWVKGVSDSITLENIYDSVNLGTNDYTALFTEDPYLVAKRCHDSRAVTVDLCADGATHIGVAIACNGVG